LPWPRKNYPETKCVLRLQGTTPKHLITAQDYILEAAVYIPRHADFLRSVTAATPPVPGGRCGDRGHTNIMRWADNAARMRAIRNAYKVWWNT
jgi:hypothetical protein